MIGGSGERKTLRLVAQYADACNIFGGPDEVAHKVDVLRRHCDDLGRDPDEIEVTAMYRDIPPNATVDDVVRGAEALAKVGRVDLGHRCRRRRPCRLARIDLRSRHGTADCDRAHAPVRRGLVRPPPRYERSSLPGRVASASSIGQLVLADHGAVDDDVAHAHRAVGDEALAVGGEVADAAQRAGRDRVVVEHHDVGGLADLERAAVVQAEHRGRLAGELVDRVLERHDVLVAHPVAEQVGREARVAQLA